MLAKSIIAGTVLSLMAGGVVYFGTDIDTSAVKEKVVEKTAEVRAEISDKIMVGGEVKAPQAETSATIPRVKSPSGKLIEAKKPTVSYSSSSEDKKVKTTDAAPSEKPQKKWLDQYLKSEKESKSDSDTASFIVKKEIEVLTEEPTEMAKAEGIEERAFETETIWVEKEPSETKSKNSTRKMLRDIIKKDKAVFIGEDETGEKKVEVKVIANEDGETTIETETIDMGDGKIMKIVKKTVKSESRDGDGKKMRVKVMTDKDGIGSEDIKIIRMDEDIRINDLIEDAKGKDISGTVNIVMEQAEKIDMPELRDRAYLELVSYGLKHGNYKIASKALTKIEQAELRDTARKRIALTYAKEGNSTDAFDILDGIESDALRDVIRLRVIEAMIAPGALPEDMQ